MADFIAAQMRRLSRSGRPVSVALLSVLLLASCREQRLPAASLGIEVHVARTLDVRSDSVDLREEVPAISSSGYAAVHVRGRAGSIAIFDPNDTLVRFVAKNGGGPGEVGSVTNFGFGPGDTLWVVDQYFLLHAFSPPPSLSYVRSVRSGVPVSGSVTRWGILSNARLWGRTVLPPVLTGWNGDQIARFGSEMPQAEADRLMGSVRLVDSTSIWSASGNAYAVDLVGHDGAILSRIARNVDWFPPGLASVGPPWQSHPRPRISSIDVDSSGLVWLLIHRARRDWKPFDAATERPRGPISIAELPSRTELSQYIEAVLDVIDAKTGARVASTVLDGAVIGFSENHYLCRAVEDSDGRVSLSLSRVALNLVGTPDRQTRKY